MNDAFKDRLKHLPILGPLTRRALSLYRKATFPGSSAYWAGRYAEGGTSGRGSYGPFATFKAEVLNGLVREFGVRSVVELGCGDGAQLALAQYPRYVGLDVSPHAIRHCVERFPADPTKSFFRYDPDGFHDGAGIFRADLALSLDVIYHLTEDAVFERYMGHLFGTATRLVVIYSNDEDRPSPAAHVRFRRFSNWIAAGAPDWTLARHIPNRFPDTGDDRTGSPSDFYVYQRAG
jgi:SAM-dependent methyltransferase